MPAQGSWVQATLRPLNSLQCIANHFFYKVPSDWIETYVGLEKENSLHSVMSYLSAPASQMETQH